MADEMEKSFYTGSLASLKEFWEDKGRTGSFEKGYHIRLEGITSIIGEIREFVDGKVVLDIGCGPGIVASLLPQSTNVIGLDFSISMLKSAKNRIGRLVRGNADRSIGCRTSIPERQKFNNRVEELRKGLFKKYEEVCRLRSRVLDLEISVEEIDSSIHRLIQKIADLIRDHIVVYEKLLEIVWPVADKEKRR